MGGLSLLTDFLIDKRIYLRLITVPETAQHF